MTVQELIDMAFRRMGVGRSASPDSNDYSHFLSGLQSMLRSWASQNIMILATVQETITLVGGVGSYSWGVGGDIATTRPHSITNALARSVDGSDSVIDIVSETEFESIANKTSNSSIPQKLFLRGSYQLAWLNLWPVPDGTCSLVVNSVKPFVEVASFSSLSDTIQFPTDYEALIVNNLAVWMAPEYGITPSPILVNIAYDLYRKVSGKNSSVQVSPVKLTHIIQLNRGVSL